MKRAQIIILILLVLISAPFISAIEIKLSKDSFQPGETLQAEITGNFISLKSENILIYKEGIPRSNPVISDLTNKEGIYYFYAILPKQEGNFSLKIENSQYFIEEELKTETISKNFTIKKTNQSSISVNPGFVVTAKDFSIKLKSLRGNINADTEFEAKQESRNFSLIEGVEKNIDFSISNLEPMQTNIKINDYNMPVFITKSTNESSITEFNELSFYPSEIKATLYPGQTYFYELKIFNVGNKNLTNLKISTDLDADLHPDSIKSIKTRSYEKINITITIPKGKSSLNGKITASFSNNNISIPVSFKITEKKEDINISAITSMINCNEVGSVCPDNEECNGVIRESKQGQCCLGNCIKMKSDNNYSITLILLLIAIAIVIFFIFKIKKRIKPKTTEEILKERTRQFRDRMNPKEVNRGLDRV
jgi:hypothetical protein